MSAHANANARSIMLIATLLCLNIAGGHRPPLQALEDFVEFLSKGHLEFAHEGNPLSDDGRYSPFDSSDAAGSRQRLSTHAGRSRRTPHARGHGARFNVCATDFTRRS